MWQIRLQYGTNVPLENTCLHNHWVTAGEQNISYFGIVTQVFNHQTSLLHSKFNISHACELGPSETKCAVCVTCLSL